MQEKDCTIILMGSLVIPFQIFHSEFECGWGGCVFFVQRSTIQLEEIYAIIRKDFFKLFLLAAILNFFRHPHQLVD